MTAALDIAAIRDQFPILAREAYGRPLVYLDNAASAQKPKAVIEAITRAMTTSYANVHRGLHLLANETTAAFEGARATAATFLNAASPEEIVFTGGGTDAINLVAYALGVSDIGEGDEIVLSLAEHHSNIVPWHLLRERKGAVLKWLDISEDGAIDIAAYRALFSKRTKLVALTHMSNVLAAPAPAKELARIAHEHGAKILFDGCQAAVHGDRRRSGYRLRFLCDDRPQALRADGRRRAVRAARCSGRPPPVQGRRRDDRHGDDDEVTYNDPPHRFEAGTPPILEAIGLGAALQWIMATGRDAIAAHEAGSSRTPWRRCASSIPSPSMGRRRERARSSPSMWSARILTMSRPSLTAWGSRCARGIIARSHS